MGEIIIFVGLDVHKDTIAVALAEAGKRGEVREHGKIVNTPAALKKLRPSSPEMGESCGFVMKPDHVAMVFSGN